MFLKERLLLKSMPRFLTDDEEFTEQPSSHQELSIISITVKANTMFPNDISQG